jgi:hypothetical protein
MRFFKNGAYLRRVSKLLYCTKHSGFRRSWIIKYLLSINPNAFHGWLLVMDLLFCLSVLSLIDINYRAISIPDVMNTVSEISKKQLIVSDAKCLL